MFLADLIWLRGPCKVPILIRPVLGNYEIPDFYLSPLFLKLKVICSLYIFLSCSFLSSALIFAFLEPETTHTGVTSIYEFAFLISFDMMLFKLNFQIYRFKFIVRNTNLLNHPAIFICVKAPNVRPQGGERPPRAEPRLTGARSFHPASPPSSKALEPPHQRLTEARNTRILQFT